MRKVLIVPKEKFDEMCNGCSVQTLSEKNRAKATILYKNIEYVVTGQMSTPGKGWNIVWANKVVDLEMYKGSIEPLERGKHMEQVSIGNRQRGYEGQIVFFEKRKLVMCEEYQFEKDERVSQLSLF